MQQLDFAMPQHTHQQHTVTYKSMLEGASHPRKEGFGKFSRKNVKNLDAQLCSMK